MVNLPPRHFEPRCPFVRAKGLTMTNGLIRHSQGGTHKRPVTANREFMKPRRQRQRERHQTKGLMSRTMAVHVRFES